MGHIIDQIFSNGLTHKDIQNMHRVCRMWNGILQGDEETNRSIWRRILFTKCHNSLVYKYICVLNSWWPDLIMTTVPDKICVNETLLPSMGKEHTEKSFSDGDHFRYGTISDICHTSEEHKRRFALFASTDVKMDVSVNKIDENMQKSQSRLLFVGGIVSTLSFCGQGGRYLLCGMLNGDIKMWEMWSIGSDNARKLEVLGRAWKVFKGHEERINALDFLDLHGLEDGVGNPQKECNKERDIIFASASDDHSFRIWSFQSGSQLRVKRSGTGTRVRAILLHEEYIMTASSTSLQFTRTNINLYKGKRYLKLIYT